MGEWLAAIEAVMNPIVWLPEEIAAHLDIPLAKVMELGRRVNSQPDQTSGGRLLYTFRDMCAIRDIVAAEEKASRSMVAERGGAQ